MTLILLGLLAWLWFRPPAEVSDETRGVPPWQVVLTDGRVLTSESLRGKVVLVNFWATWCPYCRKEKPVIDAFWKDYRGRGFEVVSISVSDTPAETATWMRDKGYAFPAAASTPSVVNAFGQVGTVPTSFVLDTEGRVRHKIAGQVHYPRLEKLIVPLLPQRPAP